MPSTRRTAALLAALLLLTAPACTGGEAASTSAFPGGAAVVESPETSDDLPERVSFDEHVVPILEAYGCVSCHGGLGGLDVVPLRSLLTTGDLAPVVVPCDADGSILIIRMRGDSLYGRVMPPLPPLLGPAGESIEPAAAGPVSPRDLEIVRRWINGGGDPNACRPRPDAGLTDADDTDADPTDAPTDDVLADVPPPDVPPPDVPSEDVPTADDTADTPPPQDTGPPPGLSFRNDILPLFLRNQCLRCHGGDGGFTCNNQEDTLLTGDHGPNVVPCDPDASKLIEKILPAPSFGDRMPIRSSSRWVPEADVETLRQWIREGARNTPDPTFCDRN